MNTIFKYEITVQDLQYVEMPAGAHILCVQVQGGYPCLWAAVDTSHGRERRMIEIIGTGNPMSVHCRCYIGTFQAGNFVWHVFERTE